MFLSNLFNTIQNVLELTTNALLFRKAETVDTTVVSYSYPRPSQWQKHVTNVMYAKSGSKEDQVKTSSFSPNLLKRI